MDVLSLNSVIEEIIFGNIPRVYGTLNNHLSPHGSSVYDFNQIHEILLCLKTANKFGVIWGAERGKVKLLSSKQDKTMITPLLDNAST